MTCSVCVEAAGLLAWVPLCYISIIRMAQIAGLVKPRSGGHAPGEVSSFPSPESTVHNGGSIENRN